MVGRGCGGLILFRTCRHDEFVQFIACSWHSTARAPPAGVCFFWSATQTVRKTLAVVRKAWTAKHCSPTSKETGFRTSKTAQHQKPGCGGSRGAIPSHRSLRARPSENSSPHVRLRRVRRVSQDHQRATVSLVILLFSSGSSCYQGGEKRCGRSLRQHQLRAYS